MVINSYADDVMIHTVSSSVLTLGDVYANWLKDNPNAFIYGINTILTGEDTLTLIIIYRLGE